MRLDESSSEDTCLSNTTSAVVVTRCDDISAGTVLGPFTIIRRLARERGQAVYLAHDRLNVMDVALKIAKAGPGIDPFGAGILRHEAEAHARITDHRHVIQSYGLHKVDCGEYYLLMLAMEYADGGTVEDWIHAGPRQRQGSCSGLAFFIQICQGIQAIHAAGMQHLDLAPLNVVISHGVAKVTDLDSTEDIDPESGREMLYDAGHCDSAAMSCVPSSPLPESPVSEDICALGELLTTLVNEGLCLPKRGARHPSVRWMATLRDIARRCTHAVPGHGYSTVGQLVQDVTAVLNGAYRRMPLLELIHRIVEESDRQALHELHSSRAVFVWDGKRLLCSDYIARLGRLPNRGKRVPKNASILDIATGLACNRFVLMPEHLGSPAFNSILTPDGSHPKVIGTAEKRTHKKQSSRTDCRRHFKAFLEYAIPIIKQHAPKSVLEEEAQVARLLQGFIRRHFVWACREAARCWYKLEVRFTWRFDGQSAVIRVSLPSSLPRDERRRWLEDNIPDPDPNRPGERERVQDIIYDKLIFPRLLSLVKEDGQSFDLPDRSSGVSWIDWTNMPGCHLAEVIASEKVRTLSQQRPRIRELGPDTLRRLILRIFEDLADGTYNGRAIAREFGLDKATLNRFARRCWIDAATGSPHGTVPDLWANTAQAIAGHPEFAEAARDMGLWNTINVTSNFKRS